MCVCVTFIGMCILLVSVQVTMSPVYIVKSYVRVQNYHFHQIKETNKPCSVWFLLTLLQYEMYMYKFLMK